MLRGVIICPDRELSATLKQALEKTRRVGIVRTMDGYPGDLTWFVFCARRRRMWCSWAWTTPARRSRLPRASSLMCRVCKSWPWAGRRDARCFSRRCARASASFWRPFRAGGGGTDAARMEQIVERRPPSIESTDLVLAFIPSKAGVGCSTIALNTSITLSQLPDTKTLLADFDLNCGIIDFMLQMDSTHSMVTAVENAHQMDEDLWQKLVTSAGDLDVIPAGKRRPDIASMPCRFVTCWNLRDGTTRSSARTSRAFWKSFRSRCCTSPRRSSWSAPPRSRACIWPAKNCTSCANLDLDRRVKILLNRAQRRSLIPISEIEKVFGKSGLYELSQRLRGRAQSTDVWKACQPGFGTGRRIWRARRGHPEWGATEAAHETRLPGHAPFTKKACAGVTGTERTGILAHS